MRRNLERRGTRQCKAPETKARDRSGIRSDVETCRLKSSDDAPVRVSGKHWRRRLHAYRGVLVKSHSQHPIEASGVQLSKRKGVWIGKIDNGGIEWFVCCFLNPNESVL